jgi:serine/threonine-protein kinase SRPK3
MLICQPHLDLHLGNVLLRLPADFDQLPIEQLYGKYGAPASEPVVRLDGQPLEPGVPSNAAPPIWLGKPSEEFSPSKVKVLLTDFGEAYSPSTECRYDSRAPLSLVPPEVRFEPERGLYFSSDIWTLACAIWAILGQRPLFEDILATQDDITAEQVDVLGRLPPEWWEKWEARHEYFADRGEPNQGRHVRSWEDRFESHIQRPRREAGIPGFDMEEKAAVMDMLRLMLSFRPDRRLTARAILKCEWMVNWALPEFEKSHFGATFTGSRD